MFAQDESSYMLIQGVTLAGVLLDEVALMPRSFVEQALARCSVSGAPAPSQISARRPVYGQRRISSCFSDNPIFLCLLQTAGDGVVLLGLAQPRPVR